MANSSSQTVTNIQPDGLPRGVKRKAELSASDRAEKCRVLNHFDRELLDRIGFWPKNRGGHGIITYHMHSRVLPDILRNKTNVNRYKEVKLCEVPEHHLAAWREANKQKCETDPLMPKYSPNMRLVCLTNTHLSLIHI